MIAAGEIGDGREAAPHVHQPREREHEEDRHAEQQVQLEVRFAEVSRTALRNAGIRAELYLGNPKSMGNQLKYADRRNSPCVIIQGSDEKARGEVQIKDLIEKSTTKHDAVSTGEACRNCHDPHASDYAALLSNNMVPLCLSCHAAKAEEMNKASVHSAFKDMDCNTCHQLLAMEEPSPKILTDLGMDQADR